MWDQCGLAVVSDRVSFSFVSDLRDQTLSGLHITDHQTRLYMTYQQTHDAAVAAAKSGFIFDQ